jgi:hypothetical protein
MKQGQRWNAGPLERKRIVSATNVTPMRPKQQPFDPPPVTPASIAAAKAAAAAERAPVDLAVRIYERRREERCIRDLIAQYACTRIHGKRSVDSLDPDQRRRLEGAAMALVRRQEPAWTQAALQQAAQCLLDEDSLRQRGLFRELSFDLAQAMAQEIVAVVFYAFVGTLETDMSAKTEVYAQLEVEAK